jgi:hypothetical protein
MNTYLLNIRADDDELKAALFALDRARVSPWAADDLPLATQQLLDALQNYRQDVAQLVASVEKEANQEVYQ